MRHLALLALLVSASAADPPPPRSATSATAARSAAQEAEERRLRALGGIEAVGVDKEAVRKPVKKVLEAQAERDRALEKALQEE